MWLGQCHLKVPKMGLDDVFGHRMMKMSHPVGSGISKHHIAWLVLHWVTMREPQVLNSPFLGCDVFALRTCDICHGMIQIDGPPDEVSRKIGGLGF